MQDTAGTDRRWQRLAIGLAVAPFVVSFVSTLRDLDHAYYLMSDWANIEMRTRDVLRHEVLYGLYSRSGWSHPGPALFEVLALPYRLTGGSSVGLYLGAILVSGAATLTVAVVARRVGGTSLLVAALIGWGVALHALGPDLVRDPWVGYVTVLPFGLLVYLSWAMTCGRWWALPAGVAVASFVIQTHVQYLVLAVPLLAWGAAWLVLDLFSRWRRRREHDGAWLRGALRPLLLAVAVLIVLWLPPMVDVVMHSPSNVDRMNTYMSQTDDPSHTLTESYRVVAAPFTLDEAWWSGVTLTSPFTGTADLGTSPGVPWMLLLGVPLIVLLWRARRTDGLKLVATVAVAVAAGVVAIEETLGPVFEYRTRWTWIIAGVALGALLWATWLVVGARVRSGTRHYLVPLAVVVLGLVTTANVVDAAHPVSRHIGFGWAALEPGAHSSKPMEVMMPSIVGAVAHRRGDVEVVTRPISDAAAESFAIGLVLQMEKRDIPGRFSSDPLQRFGNHRTVRGRAGTVLTVAVDDGFDAIAADPGGLRLVAYQGAHSRPVRARIVARRRARLAQLDADRKAGRIDDEHFEAAKFNAPDPGHAVAVFEGPPGA